MRKGIFWLGMMVVVVAQMGCDGFTKAIDVDYSDHKTKGVLFSLLTNTDERDTAFNNFGYYVGDERKDYFNRIHISNSLPPSFIREAFYGAFVSLKSREDELDLKFHEQDYQQGIDNPFYTVQDSMISGEVYRITAAFDPDAAERFVQEWSPVSAIDTMPVRTPFTIEGAQLNYDKRNDLSPKGGYIDVRIEDEAGRKNVYQFEVSGILQFGEGQDASSRLFYTSIQRPDRNTDLDLFGTSRYDLFDEEEFTKEGRKRIHFNFSHRQGPYEAIHPVGLQVRMTNLSDNYARFLQSAEQYYTNEDNPFAEPAEIYSNVEDGYGIFALGTRSYGEVEVK